MMSDPFFCSEGQKGPKTCFPLEVSLERAPSKDQPPERWCHFATCAGRAQLQASFIQCRHWDITEENQGKQDWMVVADRQRLSLISFGHIHQSAAENQVPVLCTTI